MMPIIACGLCLDTEFFGVLPFAFYWDLMFLGWSLFMGLPLAVIARRRHQQLPVYPQRYLLVALGLILALAIPTAGSVGIPVFLAATPCFARMLIAQRQFNKSQPVGEGIVLQAYQVQKIVLVVCALAVPVAYARLVLQHLYPRLANFLSFYG